jgi:hypothetical protein
VEEHMFKEELNDLIKAYEEDKVDYKETEARYKKTETTIKELSVQISERESALLEATEQLEKAKKNLEGISHFNDHDDKLLRLEYNSALAKFELEEGNLFLANRNLVEKASNLQALGVKLRFIEAQMNRNKIERSLLIFENESLEFKAFMESKTGKKHASLKLQFSEAQEVEERISREYYDEEAWA